MSWVELLPKPRIFYETLFLLTYSYLTKDSLLGFYDNAFFYGATLKNELNTVHSCVPHLLLMNTALAKANSAASAHHTALKNYKFKSLRTQCFWMYSNISNIYVTQIAMDHVCKLNDEIKHLTFLVLSIILKNYNSKCPHCLSLVLPLRGV